MASPPDHPSSNDRLEHWQYLGSHNFGYIVNVCPAIYSQDETTKMTDAPTRDRRLPQQLHQRPARASDSEGPLVARMGQLTAAPIVVLLHLNDGMDLATDSSGSAIQHSLDVGITADAHADQVPSAKTFRLSGPKIKGIVGHVRLCCGFGETTRALALTKYLICLRST